MTLPSTIRTSVSQAAITKVTRLFNGSAKDVLTELLQNARRAGASSVSIETLDLAGHATLAVSDDGRGIDDPAKLVSLGASGWDEDTARREDPAGMGVFSLAGRRVEIRSYSRAARQGWRVVIEADAWEASTPLAIEPFPIERGTEVLVDMPEGWDKTIAADSAAASLHYPLPVSFDGEAQPQRDWLADAVRVETWNGVRIGVFVDQHRSIKTASINFHGLTVAHKLPEVGEVDRGRHWIARVDIVDAPALQLVLPARKEMVRNAALDALDTAVKAVIFRAVAGVAHRLSYEDWVEARNLGITMPEAEPYLFRWQPSRTEIGSTLVGERLADVPMIVTVEVEADIGQAASRVLGTGEMLGGHLVDEVRAFEGYGWYDALPRLTAMRFLITQQDGIGAIYDDTTLLPADIKQGRCDALGLEVNLSTRDAAIGPIPAEVLIVYDNENGSGIDGATVLLARDTTIGVGALVELLEAVTFDPSTDSEADSHWTQHHEFIAEATDLATKLILGSDQALIERIRALLNGVTRTTIPDGRMIAVRLDREQLAVDLVDLEPEPLAA